MEPTNAQFRGRLPITPYYGVWSRTPQVIFWVGTDGICLDFPKMGSGKHQKHLLRELAAEHCKTHFVSIRCQV
jgi:hypothetical protein